MYEFIYGCKHIDAEIWENLHADIQACEWQAAEDYLNLKQAIDSRAPIEFLGFYDDTGIYQDTYESWYWKDTRRCQGRDYHIYTCCKDNHRVPLKTAILRHVGPDLHVDIGIAEQKGRKPQLQFTYTLSGNLIYELPADTVGWILSPAFDLELFLKRQISGLTDQQRVLLHVGPTLEEFLARGNTNTAARQTHDPTQSHEPMRQPCKRQRRTNCRQL